MEIVKVQKAIFPASDPALIYDQDRRNVTKQYLDIGTKTALGDDLKGYFRANYSNGKWHIGDRVEDQPW
jgi:hypothetical protein